MVKKWRILRKGVILMCMLVLGLVQGDKLYANQSSQVSISIGDSGITGVLLYGKTYVSVEDITNELGLGFRYENNVVNDMGVLSITNNNKVIGGWLDKGYIKDGDDYYIPIKDVGLLLDFSVDIVKWDEENKDIEIHYDRYKEYNIRGYKVGYDKLNDLGVSATIGSGILVEKVNLSVLNNNVGQSLVISATIGGGSNKNTSSDYKYNNICDDVIGIIKSNNKVKFNEADILGVAEEIKKGKIVKDRVLKSTCGGHYMVIGSDGVSSVVLEIF